MTHESSICQCSEVARTTSAWSQLASKRNCGSSSIGDRTKTTMTITITSLTASLKQCQLRATNPTLEAGEHPTTKRNKVKKRTKRREVKLEGEWE